MFVGRKLKQRLLFWLENNGLLLHCMHKQQDIFGGLASILGCPRAFSRLPTLEDWPSRPLRGLEGQISRLAASLRPGQPKILARQPKMSCCLCIQCNKRPFFHQRFVKVLYDSKFHLFVLFSRLPTKMHITRLETEIIISQMSLLLTFYDFFLSQY